MAKGEVEAAYEAWIEREHLREKELEPGKVYAFVLPGSGDRPYSLQMVDTWRENDRPRRAVGTIEASSAAGFVNAVKRVDPVDYGVYANFAREQLVAVLNDDTPTGPGWRDHRVELVLEPSVEWRHWFDNQGLKDQEAFAELIEEGLPDIVEPAAATMLELAQTFEASLSGRFKQAGRLANGVRQYVFEEDVDAKAGHGGTIDIPEKFTIRVRPYVGSEPISVEARLRHKVRDGKLQIGYLLVRPEDVKAKAFEGIVVEVGDTLDVTVVEGSAPPPATP